jgi:hypothetical protein
VCSSDLWIFDISIDFHPAKPWAVLFMGTDQKGFKYITDRLILRGGPVYVADEIVRFVKDHHYTVNSITIDPLARGDQNAHERGEYSEVHTTYMQIEAQLAAYNYELLVASRDKSNGISMLNNLLATDSGMPGLFVFDDLADVIQQLEDWMYDPDTLLPSKKEPDEWCELAYRLALLDTQWYDAPAVGSGVNLGSKQDEQYDPLGRQR